MKLPAFDVFIAVCIVISSVLLALDDPATARDTPMNRVLFVCDVVFSILFSAEALLKIVAFGLLSRGKESYLRSGWNILDLVIVLISWVSFALHIAHVSSGAVNALRALRALRPLRLIKRVPSIRAIVFAILAAIPGCMTVVTVLLFCLLIYALLGVQFFGGTFGQCDIAAHRTRDACEAAGALWFNPDMGSFDNTLSAMILLFEMMTTEMWPDVLHLMQDATEPGHAPSPHASVTTARAFSICWLVVGALFITNLFVGVLIENFEALSADERGRGMLTNEQMSWVSVQKYVVATRALRRPKRPANETSPHAAAVYDMLAHPSVELAIATFTLANAAVLGVTHYGEAEWLTDLTTYANFSFTAVWVLEAALRIFGYGVGSYFSFSWNRLDFVLVVAGVAEIVFHVLAATSGASQVLAAAESAMRLLRLLRLLRVVQALPALRHLLHGLITSLPSLGSIAGLMVLAFFIYGLLGVQVR